MGASHVRPSAGRPGGRREPVRWPWRLACHRGWPVYRSRGLGALELGGELVFARSSDRGCHQTPGSVMKFAIVVGHEALKPGARAVAPLNCYEYEYNKALAGLIACHLMDSGIQSEIFFRDGVGIVGAYDEVNKYDPLGVVELHFNAANGQAYGTETLCTAAVPESYSFARLMQVSMCSALGRIGHADRGVSVIQDGDRGYTNLTEAKCPSILVEPFFGDCSPDSLLGATKKEALAVSISQAIVSFCKQAESKLSAN